MAVKIAFLGNLDNGKSSLSGRLLLDSGSLPKERVAEVRRLSKGLGKDVELAFLTDQFEEERRESLTLDTAQAVLKTRSGERVLIDVPGHEALIRNMLSGAAQASAAVLVLDVNEGLSDQAKRHLFLADFLGIKTILVAVNKMDAAGYQVPAFAKVKESLLGYFKETSRKPPILVPVSAKEGDNVTHPSKRMAWYRGPTLQNWLEKIPREPGHAPGYFQFPVQDVYEDGSRRILAGCVDSGEVRKDQKVALFPSLAEATIEEVKKFGKKITSARKGEAIGLVLKGGGEPKRGDVLFASGTVVPGYARLERALIFWVGEEALRKEEKYSLRCATQETECRAEKIQRVDLIGPGHAEAAAQELKQNQSGFISLRLDRPILLQPFGREESLGKFVLEKDGRLVGFGIRRDSD